MYATATGEIIELAVEEGQQVKKGDLLVNMDTEDLYFQLEQQRAQLKSLKGQERMSYTEMEQQLAQLRGQLESIKGQEQQANREPYQAQIRQQEIRIEETKDELEAAKTDHEKLKILYQSGAISEETLIESSRYIERLEKQLSQQQLELELIKEQAEPLPGTEQYYSGQKSALEAQIAILEQELERSRAGGGAPTKQYYQGMIEAVQAQINHLEKQIADRKIISEMDGVVKELSIKKGMMVTPQTLMMTLVGTEDYQIETYLLTEDVISIKTGMKVKLIQERKDIDYEFEGTVISIAPSAEERVSALGLAEQRVKVTIQPEGNIPELRPGYAIDVHFTTLQQENKLAVPKNSLFPYEEGEALWVVREGRAEIQKVEKGLKTDEEVVIEKGLEPGEYIIKDPTLEGLEAGKRVKPIE